MKVSSSSDLRKPGMEVVYDVSPEAVAKFAMVEELRLVSSKMDRLYNEIASNIPLKEEYGARYKELIDATTELTKARKIIRKQYQCQKKKATKSKSQKRTSTGSVTTQKSSWKFLERLKRYWSQSQPDCEERVD